VKNQLKSIRRGFVIAFFVAVVFAAGTFIANKQQFGYVAPAAISQGSFGSGEAVAYTPWFENKDYRGDLIAYPLTANGTPLVLSPQWHASLQLATQDYLTGRHIVTTDGAGTAMSFLWDSLTPAHQATLGTLEMVNFIRGDRSNEGIAPTSRLRASVLGDIIHSNPVYLKQPAAGYADPGYLAFAGAHFGRAPRVFVGANDGMLHVFDALTGEEVYAYIPSMLVPKLTDLANDPYSHSYFVDGQTTVEDAFFDTAWHSVLVGGLGAGGIGHFALDVTSATAASDADVMDKILWEFHAGSPNATNLGYSYSRASILQLNNDKWAAVIGNGYLSATGVASLYVLDISDGSVIREIIVPDVSDNGLSSPTLIDTNNDQKVDVAYAGDRNGNLWKFDLSDVDPDNWSVSNGKPLFQTLMTDGVRLSITTPPEIGKHKIHDGYMVYVATGELFNLDDAVDTTVQAAYGIWDYDWDADEMPISLASLTEQTLLTKTHANGASVRVVTDNTIDWETQRGWVTPLIVADAIELDYGERVLQKITLRDDRVQFVTINPTIASGDNWFLQLNAFTGGAPTKTIVDVNGDNLVSLADNVDGDGNGEVEDMPLDRVIGYYLGFGLTSVPTIGGSDPSRAAALINHIEAISPTDLEFPDDPGLKGGHFDLDTSSELYDFGAGTTDGHVHQWDDKWDTTTIDYFEFPDDGKLFEIDGTTNAIADHDQPFFITITNAILNPAGIMEINGATFGVVPYYELQQRWVKGTMQAHEIFPTYKLNPPTDVERAAGVQQLISLKITFDSFAILKGELLGTNTGCVRGNDIGALGEYRNGALVVQALDAKLHSGFTYDALTDTYVGKKTALDGTHLFAKYAAGVVAPLLWESSVFWHWDGSCYGDVEWAEEWQACIIDRTTICWVQDEKAEKKAKKKKKGEKEDPPPPEGEDPPPPPVDPEHVLESVTTADGSAAGRLFWRELVPDD
jgi:hypothetical protein